MLRNVYSFMIASAAEEAFALACDDALEWDWEGVSQGVRQESRGTKSCDIKLGHFRSISGWHRGVTMVFSGKISIVIPLLLFKNDKQVFNLAELVSPYVPQCVETGTRTAGTHNCNWVEIN